MKYEDIITLLKEFDYDKNSKDVTISFLIFILNEIVNEGR